MGVFLGGSKNTNAANCALKINYAVIFLINPAISKHYTDAKYKYTMKQAVGIDTSELLAARTGIRGSNDLVWVGRAANYAAKLCSLRNGVQSTWITSDVYNRLQADAKVGGKPLRSMWEKQTWKEKNQVVYSSSWHRKP